MPVGFVVSACAGMWRDMMPAVTFKPDPIFTLDKERLEPGLDAGKAAEVSETVELWTGGPN